MARQQARKISRSPLYNYKIRYSLFPLKITYISFQTGGEKIRVILGKQVKMLLQTLYLSSCGKYIAYSWKTLK